MEWWSGAIIGVKNRTQAIENIIIYNLHYFLHPKKHPHNDYCNILTKYNRVQTKLTKILL